jgi:hypothetical protein
MKSPREVLLARHAAVQSRLDAIRRAVVAEHTGSRESVSRPGALREVTGHGSGIKWILRVSWSAMAAAWFLILTLNLATPRTEPGPGRLEGRALSAREVRWAVSEQSRLLVQLREGVDDRLRESPKSPPPGPRSESGAGLLPRLI